MVLANQGLLALLSLKQMPLILLVCFCSFSAVTTRRAISVSGLPAGAALLSHSLLRNGAADSSASRIGIWQACWRRRPPLILFLVAVLHCSAGPERRVWPPIPLIGLILAATYYIERRGAQQVASLHWPTAIFETVLCLLAG